MIEHLAHHWILLLVSHCGTLAVRALESLDPCRDLALLLVTHLLLLFDRVCDGGNEIPQAACVLLVLADLEGQCGAEAVELPLVGGSG